MSGVNEIRSAFLNYFAKNGNEIIVQCAPDVGDMHADQTRIRQALLNLVQTKAARFADTAALFQALGGGWWNAPDAVASAASGAAPKN